jgi:acetolactate synthase-1/2/3 large subunit
VLPIYDALFGEERLRHILVRHEAGAAHAAEGARSTGKPGVVLVTSGPGATNAVTGIGCFPRSDPLVVITGQVGTPLIGSDAFQEADTVGITRHCCKHNYLVKDPAIWPRSSTRRSRSPRPAAPARWSSTSPRMSRSPPRLPRRPVQRRNRYNPNWRAARRDRAGHRAARQRQGSGLYTGGGVINSGPRATELLRELQAITGAPVTSTLMGLGAFPADHEDWLGMLGMHGTYEANWAMNQADLIICVGARFDDRVTGRLDAFAPNSTKIHIDIDRASINKTVRVDLPIIGDCATVLQQILEAGKPQAAGPDRLEGARDRWRAKKSLSARCQHHRPAARDRAPVRADQGA